MSPSFPEVLSRTPPLVGVGDLDLRFDSSVLIGLRRRRLRSFVPEAFLTGAVAFALASLAVALEGSGTVAVGWAILLGLCAGVLLLVSAWLEGRQRGARRLVLNFGTETLRLDAPSFTGRPRTRLVPFDEVKSVGIARAKPGGRYQLLVELRSAPRERNGAWVLIADDVAPEEEPALLRLHTFLERAFGLKPGASPRPGVHDDPADGLNPPRLRRNPHEIL